MKKVIVVILLNFLMLSVCNAQKQKSAISIGPATLYFSLDKGKSATQTVYITNMLNRPYSFSLELIDWTLDSTGEDVYYDTGYLKHSCADWVSLDKTFMEIPAQSKEGVNVTVKIPESDSAITGARWTMLRILTAGEKKAPKKSGSLQLEMTKSLGVGVRIYQVPPANVTVAKAIKMLSFEQVGDSNTYRIGSRNTGESLLRCQYSIELASEETGNKTTVGPMQSLLLPGQVRYMNLELPKTIAKGKYTAIALIEAGEDDIPLEAAQKEIEVK